MNRISSKLINALICCSLGVSAAHAAPPRDLDRSAARAMKEFEAPGLVIVIAEGGEPTIVRPYGVRRLGEVDKVDENTLFGIGSTTKAFTSALLATLVDEGKLTWDTKVSDALPGFKMHDAYASSEMTVRDLLVHRSGLGLGAGDLMFYPPTTLTRAQIVHKLRYIEPATSFRGAYAYNNLMYAVAGQLVEAVSGVRWEDALRERILTPLQMRRTSPSSLPPDTDNRAWPHARTSGEVRGIGPIAPLEHTTNLDNVAPAGAISTSGAEMARWLELQLGRGQDPRTGARIFSEAQAKEMWSAQMVIPATPTPKPLELAHSHFRAYGLGWRIADYRGHPTISHGGAVPGSGALVVIAPQRNVAFAIMTNSEEGGALAALQYRILDHYFGLTSPDWVAATKQARADSIKARLEKGKTTSESDTPPGKPSLPIERYAGEYRDAWYGGVTIERSDGGLSIRFQHTPKLSGPLEHVRHDTFRTRWPDRSIEDAFVTFALKPDGSIDRMTMRAISPLADFSFDYHDLLFKPTK